MKVLVTAGSVYGPLDDNKIVSNRARGIWAIEFAKFLAQKHHEVILLLPDVNFRGEELRRLEMAGCTCCHHSGFEDYQKACLHYAERVDAAVLAAAVVNWIPAEPVSGKMVTSGYNPGDVINIPFRLAPRVIEAMKTANPKLTLIGCKMLSGSSYDELIEAAYGVVLHSRCNVVVANDLQNLKQKLLVYPDRTVVKYPDSFTLMYHDLLDALEDTHYHTEFEHKIPVMRHLEGLGEAGIHAAATFNCVVRDNRDGFVRRQGDSEMVFGSVAVRVPGHGWLVSPREKNRLFTAEDAVMVTKVENRIVHVIGNSKATLNAPLLIRAGEQGNATYVLHLHRQIPNAPTVPYAPPGTVRDNERKIFGPLFNITGHGFVSCVNEEVYSDLPTG